MRGFLLPASVLVVVASLGVGGWQYALERGWVAGKPNSPRPENFKRALDDYLPHTVDPQKRLCAPLGYGRQYGLALGFPDTRFYYTPPTFLARLDGTSAPDLRARLDHFARHGYLAAVQGDDGVRQYTMTWKGLGTSNGAGCMYLTGVERDASIVSFARARIEHGEEIWQVAAVPRPKTVEAWAADPAFAEMFERDGIRYQSEIDPGPVVYEMARRKDGFRVLGEQAAASTRRVPAVSGEAPPTGRVDDARLKELTDVYIAKGQGTRNYVCLQSVGVGADEATEDPPTHPGGAAVKSTVTYYNVIGRTGEALRQALLGFETMRRLESLGLASSELVVAGSHKGRAAAGGVRYTLLPALRALYVPTRSCFAVGTILGAEVVSSEQFTATATRPRFWARMRMQAREGQEAVVEKFGHLARMRDEGIPAMGILARSGDQVEVASLSWYFPEFFVDPSEVQLPVIESPAMTPPAAPVREAPARKLQRERKVPRVLGPLRPGERLVRCGDQTVVCLERGLVACGGQIVPCR
jgi:hypothetical protein